jgi:uncharacterized protein with von Willebrand factor type A (vWA) domain/WD40 repeat protein
MNDQEQPLPLLELFNRLRKAGLPLGIGEYKLALQALEHGFGIAGQEALARLCRTLWVKSGEETLLFNYHFQQVMDEWRAQTRPVEPAITPLSDPIKQRFLFPTSKLKRSWLIGSALLLVVGIGVWLATRPRKLCPYFTSAPPIDFTIVGREYRYTVVACKARETDPPPKIRVLHKPPWLKENPSSDGTVTLSGSPTSKLWQPIVRVWDLVGKVKGGFEAPDSATENTYSYLSPVSSPNGQYFAMQHSDRLIDLRDLSGRKLATLKHSGIVADVVFSPDSQFLATAAGDGSVRIWDLAGRLKQQLPHYHRVKEILFSPDGQRLATRTEGDLVRLWNLSNNQSKELSRSSSGIDGFTRDGKYLITTTTNGDAELWNLSGNRVAKVNATGFWASFDGKWIIAQSRDAAKTVLVLNWSGQQIAKLSSLNYDSLNYTCFGSNGQLIAAATDKEVGLWSLSGQQLKVLPHPNSIQNISFSPNGQRLATVSVDGTIRLWDTGTQLGQLLLTLNNAENGKVRFSADGQSLIFTGHSNTYTTALQVTDGTGQSDTQSFNIRVSPPPSDSEISNQKLGYLAISGAIFLLLLAGGYAIARWWLERISQSSVDELARELDAPTSQETSSALESQLEPEDEVQVGKAMLANQIETGEYFPVTRRQMKQSWRYLRRMLREGPPTELDVEATVKQIGQQGLLLNLVLRPRRINRSELLLLLDQEGSMVPFHSLGRRLAETALQGGRLARVGVYHFHNCPNDYLYNDPRRTEAMAINAVLNAYADSAGVLIFSDAGAAQGGLNPERVQLTQEFLIHLKQRVRYIAWLNPTPATRWQGTSAESIARLVPMFELTRQGLQEAIAVLRGKLVPYL